MYKSNKNNVNKWCKTLCTTTLHLTLVQWCKSLYIDRLCTCTTAPLK